MSKSYCARLWHHQYIHMSGHIRYCCATEHRLLDDRGNKLHMNNDSLQKAWNSKDMKQARLAMVRGDEVPACVKCVEQERLGFKSMRDTRFKERYVKSTKPDGSIDAMPHEMELHFGNLCNLKCKMCGQQYSNQIGKELLEIGEGDKDFLDWVVKESGNVNIWTNNLSVEYKWFRNEKVKRRLFEYIGKNITELVVIGGEPTVIPEFWELLNYLDQHGHLGKLELTITTNLTNTNTNLTKWLPKLKAWTIWASVDGLGERTEYIRYPSKFSKVTESLQFYKENTGNNGRIVLSPAIQLLNIDQLDDLLMWWLDFAGGNLGPKFDVSWMAQVLYPTICNYDILPDGYRNKVAEKLEKSIHRFQDHDHIINFYRNQIKNLRTPKLDNGKRIHFQKAFMRYNDTQDKHRKRKSWRQLLPDLEAALTKSVS